ncbi:MAG: hypothetical protein ACKOAR_10410 [Bacteroidota bacterium]
MNWTEQTIRSILSDMAAENPLACRALLDISAVEFTGDVRTMAVSIQQRPVLMINMNFCRQHLQSESDVKCVLLHEFLHVLLNHHLQYEVNTPLLNIALDAVINAIIHRVKGPEYSDFFCRFYEWKMPSILLRPEPAVTAGGEEEKIPIEWLYLHKELYSGKVSATDLLERLEDRIQPLLEDLKKLILLGNHEQKVRIRLPEHIQEALRKRLGNDPTFGLPGKAGEQEKKSIQALERFRINRWRRQAMAALRKCVIPDRHGVPSITAEPKA